MIRGALLTPNRPDGTVSAMRFVADLHVHSRFSRATSRNLSLPELHAWAQRKGVGVLGTGDITHPAWIEEVAEQLEPAEEGLFRLRPELAREADSPVPAACKAPVRFVLQGEVSSIYKHEGTVRKVHNLLFCPDLAGARRFLGSLDRLGNVRSDGRPILGLSSRHVLEVLLESGPGCRLIPAHIWTPWFSLLGSKSGYDSVEACFEDLSGQIFALETGLSSDPSMNWRVSALDRYALVSNSDAHSGPNLGREANEFNLDPSFEGLFSSLRPGDPRFVGTLEFFPEEGKYHLDGHRKCGRRLTPEETKRAGGRCPVCGAAVTVGVLHRVEELADRPEKLAPAGARPFVRLVPLPEVVAECMDVGAQSRRVTEVCRRLQERIGPELHVLREAPVEDVARVAGNLVAEAVRRVREGRLHVAPGYDGEFGTVRIFTPEERSDLGRQGALFALSPCRAPPPLPLPAREGEPIGPPPRPEGAHPLENEVDPRGHLGQPEGDPLLSGLNPEQRRAVEAPPGPLLVVAGPGTGKTRTLTHRIARKILFERVLPERTLAVTFTNRAAREMRERLTSLLGTQRGAAVKVSTLHALGLEILRSEAAAAGLPTPLRVVGAVECLALLRERGLSLREAKPVLASLSLAKRGAGVSEDAARWLAPYRSALDAAGAVDLDDLIVRAVLLLEAGADARARWQSRYDHVAVDEFQDLDPLQHRLLDLLAPHDVTAIGDPDQSIYGFRGADRDLFLRFLGARPGAARVALSRNYRSTPNLQAASGQILGRPPAAAGTEPGPVATVGPRIRQVALPTDEKEAEFVAREVERLLGGMSHLGIRGGRVDSGTPVGFADVAVLYRLKSQRPLLEAAFARAGIPFTVVGEEPALLRGRGKRVLEKIHRHSAAAGAGRVVRELLVSLGIDPAGLLGSAWLTAAAASGTVGQLLEAAALRTPEDDYDPRAERVTLMTLHAAKGLEFSAVFLTGVEEGIVPYLRGEEEGNGARLAEERRLLYVGVTRAKRLLCLTRAEERRIFGRWRRQEPSRFLSDIEAALFEFQDLRSGRAPSGPSRRQLSLL